MRTVPAEPDADPDQSAAPDGSPWRRWARSLLPYVPDLAVCLAFLLLAAWLTRGLWPDPADRVLTLNQRDQALYEWFLANDARVLFGDLGLLTDRLNAPDGVNLLANTTVIVLGVLLAPVTVGFGAPTTFALILTGNLALTAIAWYFLYTRTLGAHRTAAALGAGLCGFAPGMVSQSNSHLHITAQWLVPAMLWLIVRLLRAADPDGDPVRGRDARRIVTSGLGLAVVVTAQIFIGEEVLFLTAITMLVLTPAYAVLEPRAGPPGGAGFRRRHGARRGSGSRGARLPALVPVRRPAERARRRVQSPLLLDRSRELGGRLAAVAGRWSAVHSSRRGPGRVQHVPGLAAAAGRRRLYGLVGTALAGDRVHRDRRRAGGAVGRPGAGGERRSHRSPGHVLGPDEPAHPRCRATDAVRAAGRPAGGHGAGPRRRQGPAVALGTPGDSEPATRAAVPARLRGRPARLLVPGLVVGALLPVFPAPLPTADRPALPEFITAGHWRECVQPGGVLVPVPLPTPQRPWPMRWGTATNAEFGMPEGFFIGPYSSAGKASVGTSPWPTSALLADAETGALPRIGDIHRRRAQQDVDFWGASCVVLDPDAPHVEALHTTLDGLFGPATRIADVWTWKVR